MRKDKRVGLYEGMYILSATLSEESRQKAFEKITNGIAEKQGKIIKIHEQGRRKLAYPIEGKREGFYYVVFFELPTQAVAKIWEEYALHEDLIRFMTMKVEKVQETLDFQPVKTYSGV